MGNVGLASDEEGLTRDDGSELRSCTIITTEPNELIAPIHNRMPVVLHADHYRRWLEAAEQSPEDLMPLLAPYSAEEMQACAVSRIDDSHPPECE